MSMPPIQSFQVIRCLSLPDITRAAAFLRLTMVRQSKSGVIRTYEIISTVAYCKEDTSMVLMKRC